MQIGIWLAERRLEDLTQVHPIRYMQLQCCVFENERIMYDTDPTAKCTIVLHLFDYIVIIISRFTHNEY